MFLPPNVEKLDPPPTKKPRGAKLTPDVHIALNFALAPGVGGAPIQGSYVVSDSPIPQLRSAPTPGPSRHDNVAALTEVWFDAPEPLATGGKMYLPQSRKKLFLILLECVEAGRLPSVAEVLTLMDAEDPAPNMKYIDALSDMDDFGLENAFDIYDHGVCYLATFGNLGRGGARRVRQYARDKILVPLDIVKAAKSSEPSEEEIDDVDFDQIMEWRTGVTAGLEDVEVEEDVEEVKREVEERELIEVGSTDIEEEDEVEENWRTEDEL
jgi:hypothetical protein